MLWTWLARRLFHRAELPPVTPAKEHAEAVETVRRLRRDLEESEARVRIVQIQANLAARRRPRTESEP